MIVFANRSMHKECKKKYLTLIEQIKDKEKDLTGISIDATTHADPKPSNFLGETIKLRHRESEKEFKTFKSEADFHNQMIKEMSEIRLQISETRKDIQSVIAPKFFNVSIQTRDLIELAVEIWRMEQRLTKIMSILPENQRELINNSIQKLVRYLNKNNVEIVDYTNQKFNDGRNLDVLAVEKSSNATESIIKETKEPTILYKNQVVHKGKVVVLEKE